MVLITTPHLSKPINKNAPTTCRARLCLRASLCIHPRLHTEDTQKPHTGRTHKTGVYMLLTYNARVATPKGPAFYFLKLLLTTMHPIDYACVLFLGGISVLIFGIRVSFIGICVSCLACPLFSPIPVICLPRCSSRSIPRVQALDRSASALRCFPPRVRAPPWQAALAWHHHQPSPTTSPPRLVPAARAVCRTSPPGTGRSSSLAACRAVCSVNLRPQRSKQTSETDSDQTSPRAQAR